MLYLRIFDFHLQWHVKKKLSSLVAFEIGMCLDDRPDGAVVTFVVLLGRCPQVVALRFTAELLDLW